MSASEVLTVVLAMVSMGRMIAAAAMALSSSSVVSNTNRLVASRHRPSRRRSACRVPIRSAG